MKKGEKIVIGIDEAGRGPWAGPVVAACVLLNSKVPLKLLKDSKQLSALQREKAYAVITKECGYGIGIVDNDSIDSIGIKKATELAMDKALVDFRKFLPLEGGGKVGVRGTHRSQRKLEILLLIDGNDKFTFPFPHQSIIKGDTKIPAISAASIVAKVWRDKLMDLYHEAYPQYGFNKHKGYGTDQHHKALKKYGLCAIHRLSYKPVHLIAQKQLS